MIVQASSPTARSLSPGYGNIMSYYVPSVSQVDTVVSGKYPGVCSQIMFYQLTDTVTEGKYHRVCFIIYW